MPIENMRKMTPRSASALTSSMSATKPGVRGPMTSPAAMYPTTADWRSRTATAPPTAAAISVVVRATRRSGVSISSSSLQGAREAGPTPAGAQ
jgi:hypothetical protein